MYNIYYFNQVFPCTNYVTMTSHPYAYKLKVTNEFAHCVLWPLPVNAFRVLGLVNFDNFRHIFQTKDGFSNVETEITNMQIIARMILLFISLIVDIKCCKSVQRLIIMYCYKG